MASGNNERSEASAAEAASGSLFESFTVKLSMAEDTFALMEPSSPNMSLIFRKHQQKLQLSQEVEAVFTRYDACSSPKPHEEAPHGTPDFDLDPSSESESPPPRWDIDDPQSFKLHQLLSSDEKDAVSETDSCSTVQEPGDQTGDELCCRRNAIFLERKRDDEGDRLAELIAAGEEYKREFLADRERQLGLAKKSNREKEKSDVQTRERFHSNASLSCWGAVSELISSEEPSINNINNKPKGGKKFPNRGPKPGKPTDLTRMRQLILKRSSLLRLDGLSRSKGGSH